MCLIDMPSKTATAAAAVLLRQPHPQPLMSLQTPLQLPLPPLLLRPLLFLLQHLRMLSITSTTTMPRPLRPLASLLQALALSLLDPRENQEGGRCIGTMAMATREQRWR